MDYKYYILKKHNKNFLDWFKDTIFADDNAYEMLRKLTDRSKRNVITWQEYNINKYSFYTKAQDEKSKMQNKFTKKIIFHVKLLCMIS